MNPLVVYADKNSATHKKTVENVKLILSEFQHSVYEANELNENCFSGKDLIITIGGDGTFIKAASFIKDDTPILGINSEPGESEGALTSVMHDEIGLIKEVLKGNFKTIQRDRIDIELNNQLLEETALNEVYVGVLTQFHTSRYKIKFDGLEEEQRSSGVVIASGSGSNAWYKSAGGVPFAHDEKKLKFIVREPYVGSRLFKPKILHGEIQPRNLIELESKRIDGGVIAIDATKVYDFNKGAIVRIRLSNKPLHVIVK